MPIHVHSSPRPEMSSGDFALWLDACQSVASARGVPRRRPRPATLPDAWAYAPNHPAPVVAGEFAKREADESAWGWRKRFATIHQGIRSIEFFDDTDEYGEPYAYPLGSEVEMGAYRALERERITLERKYVSGHRFPSFSPFGPEETRFRTLSTEPYFPDICGTFHHRTGDRIVWNDYVIGKDCGPLRTLG